MKVFIPQGVSCFSETTFDCTSTFENWQQVLKEEGQRVCSGRKPDSLLSSTCTCGHSRTGADENSCFRDLHFSIWVFWSLSLDPDYTGVGHTGPMWRREWLGYLSQQSKAPTQVSVRHGDFIACYERGECTSILQDVGMWLPLPLWSPREVVLAALIPLLPSKPLGIRYSSLDDGGVAVSRMIESCLLIWMLFSRQLISTHLLYYSRQRRRQKVVCRFVYPSNTRVRAFPGCLCCVLTLCIYFHALRGTHALYLMWCCLCILHWHGMYDWLWFKR